MMRAARAFLCVPLQLNSGVSPRTTKQTEGAGRDIDSFFDALGRTLHACTGPSAPWRASRAGPHAPRPRDRECNCWVVRRASDRDQVVRSSPGRLAGPRARAAARGINWLGQHRGTPPCGRRANNVLQQTSALVLRNCNNVPILRDKD